RVELKSNDSPSSSNSSGSSSSSSTGSSSSSSSSSNSSGSSSKNNTSKGGIDTDDIVISSAVGNVEAPLINTNITIDGDPTTIGNKDNENIEDIENNDDTSLDKEAVNSLEDENDKGHTGLVTGVAVTGSVVGAAALIIFKKKNPRQYEQLKQNISRSASAVKRSASTVKRSASSVTRKLTTKKERLKIQDFVKQKIFPLL
ncbi:hypothetical protein PIROE2DRAFT_7061, partial [Piromyces sp. E2]